MTILSVCTPTPSQTTVIFADVGNDSSTRVGFVLPFLTTRNAASETTYQEAHIVTANKERETDARLWNAHAEQCEWT